MGNASRWWLAPTAVLALVACDGGGDRADTPPLATATQITPGASTATGASTTASTAAPPTDASTSTRGAPPVTSGSAPAPAGSAATPPSADAGPRWPSTVAGRKVLDQAGDTY